ncbi:hypothetical protein [uncultured Alistipes sp.]|uniref:hypothetical protein n=1 Tax=uncultured Alistipes sp. TaxID=538949 RepID=UPI0025E3DB05|nr:hypothetical protein [uncultured Alistipes sp.]
MTKIETLDQFDVSQDRSLIRYYTDIAGAKKRIAELRLEMLSEVNEYLWIGGAEQPIEIIGRLMSTISYYEEAVTNLYADHLEVAERYFDEPRRGFDNTTIFGTFELIKFLNKIECLFNRVKEFEERASTITYLKQ